MQRSIPTLMICSNAVPRTLPEWRSAPWGGHILQSGRRCCRPAAECASAPAFRRWAPRDTVHKGICFTRAKAGSALVGQQHEPRSIIASPSPEVRFFTSMQWPSSSRISFTSAALEVHAAALGAQAGTVGVQFLHGGQLVEYLVVLGLQLIAAVPASRALISE